MASSFHSFDKSPAGAFIQSPAKARQPSGGLGHLIFAGAFTTFGGVTHTNIAVWNRDTETYESDSAWGFTESGVDPVKVLMYQDTIYVAGNDGDVYRGDNPGWTKIYNGSSGFRIMDMVVWQGKLVIAPAFRDLQLWDGSTITNPGLPGATGVRVESLGVVTSGGEERLAFLYFDSTALEYTPGYYNGTTWTYGSIDADTSVGVETASKVRRWCQVDSKFYFFRNIGTTGAADGVVIEYDPATNTSAIWNYMDRIGTSAPPEDVGFRFADVDIENTASIAAIGGKLVMCGWQTHFTDKDEVDNACDYSIALSPTTFAEQGDAITQVGGFLTMPSEIYEPHGSKIFVADRLGGSGVVTQLGGGTIDGGASLKLVTFDGSTWESWPEQPNGGITSIFEADTLPG